MLSHGCRTVVGGRPLGISGLGGGAVGPGDAGQWAGTVGPVGIEPTTEGL